MYTSDIVLAFKAFSHGVVFTHHAVPTHFNLKGNSLSNFKKDLMDFLCRHRF